MIRPRSCPSKKGASAPFFVSDPKVKLHTLCLGLERRKETKQRAQTFPRAGYQMRQTCPSAAPALEVHNPAGNDGEQHDLVPDAKLAPVKGNADGRSFTKRGLLIPTAVVQALATVGIQQQSANWRPALSSSASRRLAAGWNAACGTIRESGLLAPACQAPQRCRG